MQTQTPSIHLLLAKKSSNTETRETLLQAQIQIMSIEKAIILNSEGGWWGGISANNHFFTANSQI